MPSLKTTRFAMPPSWTARTVASLSAVALLSSATLAFPLSVLAAPEAAPPSPPTVPANDSAPASAGPISATPAPSVTPAESVSLIDGAHPAQVLTTGAHTVADVLAEAKVVLGGEDQVAPPLTAPVSATTPIVITRVRTETQTETSPIPFKTVFAMSHDVAPGHIQKGHHGVPGVLTKTFQAKFVNDKLTSRVLIAKAVTKAPINQETLGGIRTRAARALPSRGGYNRMRCLTMTATGYSPYEGSGSGRCATGMRAGYGVVAVDPRVIPLRSRLYVEGYGYAVAGDTGGAIKGRRIDLGHTTFREAASVGRKHVKVWLLKPSR